MKERQRQEAGEQLKEKIPDEHVILQCLTTGLPGQPVEFALIREDGRALVKRVCPSEAVSHGSQKIHGISTAAVLTQPRLTDIATQIERFIGKRAVITWNTLHTEAMINGLKSSAPALREQLAQAIDAQEIIYQVIGDPTYGPPKLDTQLRLQGRPARDPRSALSSAEAVQDLLKHYMNKEVQE